MSHCEENREIYVRVKDSTDYECIKAIFEKYKLSINTYRGSLVLNDVWVSLNNEQFSALRREICEAAPDCLLLGVCNYFYPSTGYSEYIVYPKYPDEEDEDIHMIDMIDDSTCPSTNNITDLQSCLEWCNSALEFPPHTEAEISLYKLWGEEIDEDAFRAADNDDSIEAFLKSLVVNASSATPEITDSTQRVFRFCAVAKDAATLELIRKEIKESLGSGSQLLSLANVLPDKNMLYVAALDSDIRLEEYDLESLIDSLSDADAGMYLIACEQFDIWEQGKDYWGYDYIQSEGLALLTFGDKILLRAWDCSDEEMYSNRDLNITDLMAFMDMYRFGLDADKHIKIMSLIDC